MHRIFRTLRSIPSLALFILGGCAMTGGPEPDPVVPPPTATTLVISLVNTSTGFSLVPIEPVASRVTPRPAMFTVGSTLLVSVMLPRATATAVREATRKGQIGTMFAELVETFHAARRWT